MKNGGYMKQIQDYVEREQRLHDKEIAFQERQAEYKRQQALKEELAKAKQEKEELTK